MDVKTARLFQGIERVECPNVLSSVDWGEDMLYCLCAFQRIFIQHLMCCSTGAEMALHEERSELMSEQWLSRLAKQRHDLSASVEAALIDETVQERELQD